MTMRMKNTLLLAKLETRYGVDANPNNTDDVIKASDVSLTPIETDEIERNYVGSGIGTSPKTLTSKRVQLVFSIELTSSGSAGSAPRFGHLLKASGFGEALTSGSKATYTPNIDATASLTICYNMDGNLHKLTGARGAAVFNLNANEVPTIQFTFIGLFVSPITTSALQGKSTFRNWLKGKVISKANTPTATIDSQAVSFANLSFDMGDTLSYVNRTNMEEVARRDRNVSGSCTIGALPIAVKNLWATVENETLVPIKLVHGTSGGEIIDFTITKAQLTAPAYADNEGEAMQSFNIGCLPDSGNDEISIVFK